MREQWRHGTRRRRDRTAAAQPRGEGVAVPRLGYVAHRARSTGWASRRSRCPTARTACAGSPMSGDHVGLVRQPARPPASRPRRRSGSSWDVGAGPRGRRSARAVRRARRASPWCSGPGINIKRSPLCGRNFEYLSEDPRAGRPAGCSDGRGIQGEGVGTSLKHFAANNQETDRLRVSAEVDERTLREIYLPAFEHVVTTARPWTVMCAYNRINGTYASQHEWLLTIGTARRVGLRRAGDVRLGCGARPGGGAGCRAGPRDAAQPRRERRRDRRRGAPGTSTRPSWTPRCGACCNWCARATAAPGRLGGSMSTPTTVGPRGGARLRSAAEERRRHAAVAAVLGADACRDRRVRPLAAIPGRRQLAGEPDPRRQSARRGARRRAGRRRRGVRRRLHAYRRCG